MTKASEALFEYREQGAGEDAARPTSVSETGEGTHKADIVRGFVELLGNREERYAPVSWRTATE